MLFLYTDYSKFDESQVMFNNDAVFNAHTKKMNFDNEDYRLMQKYDGAQIKGDHDAFGKLIQTKYGATHIGNLSTGLKTLLNLRHIKNLAQRYIAVDITEAGENILPDIFKTAAETGVPVILRHADLPDFEEISITVDDTELITNNIQLARLIRAKE